MFKKAYVLTLAILIISGCGQQNVKNTSSTESSQPIEEERLERLVLQGALVSLIWQLTNCEKKHPKNMEKYNNASNYLSKISDVNGKKLYSFYNADQSKAVESEIWRTSLLAHRNVKYSYKYCNNSLQKSQISTMSDPFKRWILKYNLTNL